ncbi:MAG: DNA ligase, partial [Gammaproteobacteria bacterium]
MLTKTQIEILNRSGLNATSLDHESIESIAESHSAHELTTENLLDFLKIANALYRAGEAIISDKTYDSVFLSELKSRNPLHPYLHAVEPERSFTGKTVELPVKMLSTEKTYTLDGVKKWLARIEKAALELGLDFNRLLFRMTPKLDGFAAYDDGEMLFTRGDGRRGTDITRVFDRGLAVEGDGKRGQGAGEIVVSQRYFSKHLAEHFENARNFQASIIKEKELEQHALEAIRNKAAVFFPFSALPDRVGTADEILRNFDQIVESMSNLVDYDVDGVIIEALDDNLKSHLGSTRHHHRWQIAYKSNTESARVKILQVVPQTSRSGRVNPVAELEPTRLSGALISRATAHHYGMVKELGIGKGALIELTRSGLVIPKIERVITPVEPEIPDRCPSCGEELVWEKDYLYCPNTVH